MVGKCGGRDSNIYTGIYFYNNSVIEIEIVYPYKTVDTLFRIKAHDIALILFY